MQLTPEFVASAPPGVHPDGAHGLRLRVKRNKTGSLSKAFECRVYEDGKRKDRYVGAAGKVTLTDARKQAAEWHSHADRVRSGVKREAEQAEREETERLANEKAKAEAAKAEAENRETAIKVAAADATSRAVENAAARISETIFPAFREAFRLASMDALASFNDPLAGFEWIVAAHETWPMMLGTTPDDQRDQIKTLAKLIPDTAIRREWSEAVTLAGRECLTGPEAPLPAHLDEEDFPPAPSGPPTFAEAAAIAVPLMDRNARHKAQVMSRLERHAFRYIGRLSVDRIERKDVKAVLLPLHRDGKRVALSVKGDMVAVLAWAIEEGHCAVNVAAGSFKRSLPKLPARKNFAALKMEQGPEAYQQIAPSTERSRALALVALTAVRAKEAAQADWSEFDLDSGMWTIPGERMKAKRTHSVPLSEEAVALLGEKGEGHVFPRLAASPKSTAAMLRAMKCIAPDATVHGWRSTFRIWAERNSVEFHLAEWCIAHIVGDETVQAYLRSETGIERRREVMSAWAAYLTGEAS